MVDGGRTKHTTRDRGSDPESCLGLGLGIKRAVVRERRWFWCNVNKHAVSEVTVNFFCTKPDYDLFLTLTKRRERLKTTNKKSVQVDVSLQEWIRCL